MQDLSPVTPRLDPDSFYSLEGPATVRIETPPPTLRETPASKVDGRFTTCPPPRPFPERDTTATKLRSLATAMWGPPGSLPDSKRGALTAVPSSAPLPPTRR